MKVRWAVATIAAVIVLAAWLSWDDPPLPEKVAALPLHESAGPTRAPMPPLPAVAAATKPAAPILARRALASPRTTIQSQLSLLADNQYELFVQTFAERSRPSVTREAFNACRVRINQVPVNPDWEMAEESLNEGRRLVAVSVYGKSLTSFEETDGSWLAASLWCVPVGLP